AAATSSWVESGFDPHRNTCAPPACSVRARFAVSVVTCRQAEIRRPLSGRSFANRERIARSTGMWRSAHSIRALPSFASFMSFTSPAVAVATATPFVDEVLRAAMADSLGGLGLREERTRASMPDATDPHKIANPLLARRVLKRYAYTYEANDAADRARAGRRAAPPGGGGGPHPHRGDRARAAGRARGRAPRAAPAREPPLLRPRPLPRGRRAPRPSAAGAGGRMIAVDAGLLVLAANRWAPEHARAASLLESLAEGERPWALTWSAVHEFVGFVTHPHAVARPLAPGEAWAFVESLAERASRRCLGPTARHAAACAEVLALREPGTGLPGSFATAATLREHGVRELLSTDPDMVRWRFLDVADPLRDEAWRART